MADNNLIIKKGLDEGIWAVVKSTGASYIGRLVARNGMPCNDKSQVLELLNQYKDWVGLCPVYDFMAPVQPMQLPNGEQGLSRRPIIMPHEFQTTDAVYYVKVDGIQFFDDLSKDDKAKYEEMAKAAADALLNTRAQVSGIHLASSMG